MDENEIHLTILT